MIPPVAARQRRLRARDGLEIAALDWPGDPARTPLLCLAGLCRTALDFESLAARHAGRRRVVALDHAGHGESGRAAEVSRYSPRHALSDVLDACAALGLDRVVVVGTSFGGLLAMFLSVLRPAILAGAAINDIGPRIETGGLEAVRGFAGRDPGFATLEEAVPYLRTVMPRMPLRDEAAWLRFADLTYRRGADGLLHPRWDTRIVQAMAASDGGEFGAVFRGLRDRPCALVWAEESEILSRDTVREMVRAKPDLHLIAFPGAGHAPTLAEPEVAPALDRFLNGLA